MNIKEFELKSISDHFAIWENRISNLNSLNLYDANIFSEHSICELLNYIYDYKLQNINSISKNSPAIDLGDKYNRVSFQITSTSTAKKIQSTIDKFIEHNLSQDYDELYILILGKKQRKYPAFNGGETLSFDSKRNIIDFHDLLNFINLQPIDKIKKIHKFLGEENAISKNRTTQRSPASRIKRNLALKKRLTKDFLRKLPKEHWEHSWFEPWIKFTYGSAIIREVNDTKFPNSDPPEEGRISTWFKLEFWDFYENGIEFISHGCNAIIDKDGYWDLLKWDGDDRDKNPSYKVVYLNEFLRIPYDYIAEYDMDTDPYYGYPTIYVEYLKDNMPYEEILYGQAGIYKNRKHTIKLDNNNRRKLE